MKILDISSFRIYCMIDLTKHTKSNQLVLGIGILATSFGVGMLSIHEMNRSLSDPAMYLASFLFMAGIVLIVSALVNRAKQMIEFPGDRL